MDFLLIRTIFFSETLFAFLNSIKVLKIPIQSSWFLFFLLAVFSWLLWEKAYKKNLYLSGMTGIFFGFQLSADLLGNAFNLYERFTWYDKFTHFTGGATIGLAILLILDFLYKKNNWNFGSKTFIIFTLSLSLSIGVMYEFWEYFIYSVLNYKQVITGLTDTSQDLLMDFLGSLLSILLFSRSLKKSYSPSPNLTDSKTK